MILSDIRSDDGGNLLGDGGNLLCDRRDLLVFILFLSQKTVCDNIIHGAHVDVCSRLTMAYVRYMRSALMVYGHAWAALHRKE